jgi:hypothetical protein
MDAPFCDYSVEQLFCWQYGTIASKGQALGSRQLMGNIFFLVLYSVCEELHLS